MMKASLTGQRLVVLFFLGLVAFNFPVLGLFEKGGTVFGVPVLYAYAYGAWAALIFAMARVAGRRDDVPPASGPRG
ncbi:MAG: hypothetical protein PHU46_03190 [Rhodocyclaceae bacterium]|nr:hypothetical protein [Rhodocyclaceae bacterium]